MTSSAHEAHSDQVVVDRSHHAHVCSFQSFLGVYVALLFLTVVTVAVSRIDFGDFNMFIAVAIGALKASLVMTVFMHLRWDTAINNIAFLSSLLFLSLLFLFTIADVVTRGEADLVNSTPAPLEAPKFYPD
jgi:cytochrome c oxidase subunit 4